MWSKFGKVCRCAEGTTTHCAPLLVAASVAADACHCCSDTFQRFLGGLGVPAPFVLDAQASAELVRKVISPLQLT